MSVLSSWRERFWERQKFCTPERSPFFETALNYLSEHDVDVAVDIGAGRGEFADLVMHRRAYRNLVLLEGNEHSVIALRSRHKQVIRYRAPERLPFENETVHFIHCSHLVEHLSQVELHDLLKEIDRVMKPGGVLVVSAPLLWSGFYGDLTHVRPYNPMVFLSYLSKSFGSRSAEIISDRYKLMEITYRYAREDWNEGLASSLACIDLILYLHRRLLRWLRIFRYVKNGYTLVLKKGATDGP